MINYSIIGLTAKKRSGKDTVGDYLVLKYGYKKIAYADALKSAIKCIFDFTDNQLYGTEKEIIDPVWNITPRETFQFVGTQLFRNQINELLPELNDNIWIKVVENKIQNELIKNPNQKFVITDIRFENECDIIRKMNGLLIKITRSSINNDDKHESENNINNIQPDYIINNDENLSDLYNKIDLLMKNK